MAIFKLQLQKTYFAQGFFNVVVDYDRFVRSTEGPVTLRLGRTGEDVQGRINRGANTNGTARILAGPKLRDYFQKNFKPMGIVAVDLASMDLIVLDKPGGAQ